MVEGNNNNSIEKAIEDKTLLLSDAYKDIFKTYLGFYPELRRSLVDLPQMYKWLKELDLASGLNEQDFYILMEWFSSLNLIKPFFILHYPPEHNHHICYNDSIKLTNEFSNFKLRQLHDDGLINFPDSVYIIKASEFLRTEKWMHNKIEHKIITKSKNTKEEAPYEEKISIEEKRYFYHPIQFFQLLTYLKNSTYKDLKDYKEFYWKRRLDFNDYIANNIRSGLKEKNKQLDEFIQEESSDGLPFDQFLWIFYSQNRWLREPSLELWIKIESFYAPILYFQRRDPEINMYYQSKGLWFDKEQYREFRKRHFSWRKDVIKNFDKYFFIDEYNVLKEFRELVWRYIRFDGLDYFIDLFLHISDDKKDKLKGFPNYWINMVNIFTILKGIEHEYFNFYSDLSEFKTERKFFEPKYVFKDQDELAEHKKKVFLDFGLTQEETYVIFTEGPTETLLLHVWTELVFYRTGIRLNIKQLGGKRKKFIFEYLTREFKVNEFFLVLDQDTEVYAEGLKSNLAGKGISEEQYYIFYPDFVTANFTAQEIFEAFVGFIKELKDEIEQKSDQRIDLEEINNDKVLLRLKNKNDIERYEDLIEECLRIILKNPDYELNKTAFANHLLNVMRKNLSKSPRTRKYSFEEILGKFVDRIQAKIFPH